MGERRNNSNLQSKPPLSVRKIPNSSLFPFVGRQETVSLLPLHISPFPYYHRPQKTWKKWFYICKGSSISLLVRRNGSVLVFLCVESKRGSMLCGDIKHPVINIRICNHHRRQCPCMMGMWFLALHGAGGKTTMWKWSLQFHCAFILGHLSSSNWKKRHGSFLWLYVFEIDL